MSEESDTVTVDIVGPWVYSFEIPRSKVEKVMQSDTPISEVETPPVEKEPMGDDFQVSLRNGSVRTKDN